MKPNRSLTGGEKLLLLNAILCYTYAICYMLLILFFPGGMLKTRLDSQAEIILNTNFLAELTLTLNTLYVMYRQLAKPRKYVRLVYSCLFTAWLLYVMSAYWFTFFAPSWFMHFHHSIQHTFREWNWLLAAVSFLFAAGFSVLFREYYRQVNMRHVLFFIIPAIFLYSFKAQFPFLFFIMGWFVFGGCQLLLYFSILDGRRGASYNKDFIIA